MQGVTLKILEYMTAYVSCYATGPAAVCNVPYHFSVLLNPFRHFSYVFKALLNMIKKLSHLSREPCLLSCILWHILVRKCSLIMIPCIFNMQYVCSLIAPVE